MLFLLAAGLTLVFGVMDMINLAHGSLYMVGAFLAAWLVGLTGSFVLGVAGAVARHGAVRHGARDRRCCARSTRATTCRRCSRPSPLILILNDGVTMIFGNDLPLLGSRPRSPARSSCCPGCSTRPTGC